VSIPIGPYTVGEIPAPIVVTFKDSTGAALDLSAAGWVGRWIYREHKAGTSGEFSATDPAAVTQTANVDHGGGLTKGQVTYPWVVGDFAAGGDYEGEMWIGNGTNRFASGRFAWTTQPAIAVPAI
jgi:hypothetical protein